MRLTFILLAATLAGARPTQGQHLYPQKFEGCVTRQFCLDCGEPKASYPTDLTAYFRDNLPAAAVRRARGGALVQVLVDSAGRPCALSQASNLPPPVLALLDLRGAVNRMTFWRPALEKGQPVRSSVSLRFAFDEGPPTVTIQHFDFAKMQNMRSVGTVEVVNKGYAYPKPPRDLQLEVFNTTNSKIPWDMMRAVAFDRAGTGWVGTDNGLVQLDPTTRQMQVLNATNSGLRANKIGHVGVSQVVVDARGHKWLATGYHAYRFDGTSWTHFDSTTTPLRWVVRIVPDAAGNVWFAGGKRLVKFDGQGWTEITASNAKLPPGSVNGLFVDRQRRVWVSTYRGASVCLEGEKVTEFQQTDSPLARASLSAAGEDADGTIWFGLADPDRQGRFNGLARLSPAGQWTSFTAENSGYPGNSVNSLVVDQQRHVVWLGVNRVGLCRFDGQTWTLLTPENSALPSTIVWDLALAPDGSLWGATFAGLFRLTPW